MMATVVDNGEDHGVLIREGEIFLLTPHARHSLQPRQESSISLGIERERPEGALDAIEWYCFERRGLMHRAGIDRKNNVDDLPPIYRVFYEDGEACKGSSCRTVHPGKQTPDRWVCL